MLLLNLGVCGEVQEVHLPARYQAQTKALAYASLQIAGGSNAATSTTHLGLSSSGTQANSEFIE